MLLFDKAKENVEMPIRNPGNVARVLYEFLAKEDVIDREKEHFWAIGLNTSNSIRYIDVVSIGTLNNSLVHPRETFRNAISFGISGIIVAHNHPSGNCTPSDDDQGFYTRLSEAGKILGIELMDSIIIGNDQDSYFSTKSELSLVHRLSWTEEAQPIRRKRAGAKTQKGGGFPVSPSEAEDDSAKKYQRRKKARARDRGEAATDTNNVIEQSRSEGEQTKSRASQLKKYPGEYPPLNEKDGYWLTLAKADNMKPEVRKFDRLFFKEGPVAHGDLVVV